MAAARHQTAISELYFSSILPLSRHDSAMKLSKRTVLFGLKTRPWRDDVLTTFNGRFLFAETTVHSYSSPGTCRGYTQTS
jgi:hypothetical protein